MNKHKRPVRVALALAVAGSIAVGLSAVAVEPAAAASPACEAKAAYNYGMARWYQVFGPDMGSFGTAIIQSLYEYDAEMALMGRNC
jgi:hypothetical protein